MFASGWIRIYLLLWFALAETCHMCAHESFKHFTTTLFTPDFLHFFHLALWYLMHSHFSLVDELVALRAHPEVFVWVDKKTVKWRFRFVLPLIKQLIDWSFRSLLFECLKDRLHVFARFLRNNLDHSVQFRLAPSSQVGRRSPWLLLRGHLCQFLPYLPRIEDQFLFGPVLDTPLVLLPLGFWQLVLERKGSFPLLQPLNSSSLLCHLFVIKLPEF